MTPQLALTGFDQVHLEDSDAPDRDTWCTPKWLADALGHWEIDPCSNSRSHVQADERFDLSRGQDGLNALVAGVYRVFINPPYSRGQVIRWVNAYKHTRFCFLLRFDPSTEWFDELMRHTAVVAVPNRRVNFEPPPGVESSSNPFPHGLFYADEDDATDEIRRLCFVMRTNFGPLP